MITLYEVADLLAEYLGLKKVTAGAIDASLTQTVGIYQREPTVPRECIGSEPSYQTAKLRILIHWNNNPTETEKKALEISNLISAFREMPTNGHIIKFAAVKSISSIGKDEKGICEWIVDADIIYSNKEE